MSFRKKTQQNTDKVEPGFCISPPSLSAPSPADTFHLICFLFAKLDTFGRGDMRIRQGLKHQYLRETSWFIALLKLKKSNQLVLVCSHSFFAFSITSEGFILPMKIWRVGLLRGLWTMSEKKKHTVDSMFQSFNSITLIMFNLCPVPAESN